MGPCERPRNPPLYLIHSLVVSLCGTKNWWVSLCANGKSWVPSEWPLFFLRELLKHSQKSTKVEGPEPVPAEASLIAEQGTMTEVKVKTEVPDDYIQEVIWQGEAKEENAGGQDGTGDVPAEICVVIGGVRNQQTLGECLSENRHQGRNV